MSAYFRGMSSTKLSDWSLIAIPGLIWGASFLFIAEGLEAVGPFGVTLVRVGVGFAALACFKAAWKPIERRDWPAIVWLAVLWMAFPLSMFPFALIVVSILGSVTADEETRQRVLMFVLRYFPGQFDFITAQLDAFRQNPIRLGVGGGILLVWGALGVFGAISTAVNHAWGVEKARSFLGHRIFSFLMLLAAGFLATLKQQRRES